jgi:hypothetical protein
VVFRINSEHLSKYQPNDAGVAMCFLEGRNRIFKYFGASVQADRIVFIFQTSVSNMILVPRVQ